MNFTNSLNRIQTTVKNQIGRFVGQPFLGKFLRIFLRTEFFCRGIKLDARLIQCDSTLARLFFGFYESKEIHYVRNYLKRDVAVIELGSSYGVVSSIIASKADHKSLICVEANPHLIPIIEHHLTLNGAKHFAILNYAVSYESDDVNEVNFLLGPTPSTSRLLTEHDLAQPRERVLTVPCTTLSRLLSEHKVNEYSLVMDIEGAEATILSEDIESLNTCVQLIAELHEVRLQGSLVTESQLVAQIERAGFHSVAQHGSVYVFEK